ncbi:MAG: hypothetical protein WKG01_17335 [Kofleriaceae bacterium]
MRCDLEYDDDVRIAITIALFSGVVFASCKDDKPTPDAGRIVDGGTCAGTLGLTEVCTNSDECATCVCRSFGHAMNCTQACDASNPCPAPSSGCSNGFCRP